MWGTLVCHLIFDNSYLNHMFNCLKAFEKIK